MEKLARIEQDKDGWSVFYKNYHVVKGESFSTADTIKMVLNDECSYANSEINELALKLKERYAHVQSWR